MTTSLKAKKGTSCIWRFTILSKLFVYLNHSLDAWVSAGWPFGCLALMRRSVKNALWKKHP